MIDIQTFVQALDLEVLYSPEGETMSIKTPEIVRPGLQLSGYYEYFDADRIQVLGIMEMTFLDRMTPSKREDVLNTFFSYHIPGVVICRGLEPQPEFYSAAARHQTPLFRTQQVTTRFCARATNYLNQCLAPHETRHGVLVDVYGIGVLLIGKSGIGKSEAALELVKRGHQLVADDAVDICRITETRLIGSSPNQLRHFMEVRGIGLIDVRAIFGVGAVSGSHTIDLVIELKSWEEAQDYDRLGLAEKTLDILGVAVPWQIVPVAPGRNLAIVVEVSARNLSLKRMGYNSAREFLSNFHDAKKEDNP